MFAGSYFECWVSCLKPLQLRLYIQITTGKLLHRILQLQLPLFRLPRPPSQSITCWYCCKKELGTFLPR